MASSPRQLIYDRHRYALKCVWTLARGGAPRATSEKEHRAQGRKQYKRQVRAWKSLSGPCAGDDLTASSVKEKPRRQTAGARLRVTFGRCDRGPRPQVCMHGPLNGSQVHVTSFVRCDAEASCAGIVPSAYPRLLVDCVRSPQPGTVVEHRKPERKRYECLCAPSARLDIIERTVRRGRSHSQFSEGEAPPPNRRCTVARDLWSLRSWATSPGLHARSAQ